MLGTMIGMFDFVKQLPYPDSFLGGTTVRNAILHIFSTVLCYILCCIRNTKFFYFILLRIDNYTLCRGLAFLP